MLYPVILFIISGALGTVLALRLMALDAQETPTRLTVRGRVVVGISIGIAIAIFVILLSGMWWDCDLRAGSTTPCVVGWGF
jgi:hypothetical protein